MSQKAKVEVVITNFNGDYPNQLEMWVKILPDGFGTRAMLTPKPFQCHGLWSLHSPSPDHNLTIICKKKGFYQNALPYAELRLPISWFEMNKVVTDWFPMKYSSPNNKSDLRLKLQIHLHNDDAKPFQAPNGKLLVVPSWQRPIEEAKPNPTHNLMPLTGITFLPKPHHSNISPISSFARRKSDFSGPHSSSSSSSSFPSGHHGSNLSVGSSGSSTNYNPKYLSMFCPPPFNPLFKESQKNEEENPQPM